MTAIPTFVLSCFLCAAIYASAGFAPSATFAAGDQCDGDRTCAAASSVVARNLCPFAVDVYAELELLPGRSMAPWDFRAHIPARGEARVGASVRWIATRAGTDLPIFEGSTSDSLVIEEQPRVSALNQRAAATMKVWNEHGAPVDLHKLKGVGKPSDHTVVATLPVAYRNEVNIATGEFLTFTVAGKPKRVLVGPITWDGNSSNLFVVPKKKSTPKEQWPAQARAAAEHASGYREATGRTYLGHFGSSARPVPMMFMHRAEHVGERIVVPGKRPIQLEALSLAPRVFLARNFLSAAECDKIIATAATQMQKTDTLGPRSRAGTMRTGERAWLNRKSHSFVDRLYHRAARLMNATLHEDNAEQLQVVHYQQGENYFSHFDCDFSKLHTRAATLLLYLTDHVAGGETSFPRAFGKRGLRLHPGKGSAVLFYSVLEDGNIDELAQHASLPVVQGDKWLCNLWRWDSRTDFS